MGTHLAFRRPVQEQEEGKQKMDREKTVSLLETKDLHVEFVSVAGRVFAIRGVSFSLKRGETLALVGESGCGKTVLCRSIAGLLPSHGKVTSGEICLEGRKLTGADEAVWRKVRQEKLGLLWQNPMAFFHPSIPVGKQIIEGLLLSKSCSKKEAVRRAGELLIQLEIPDAGNRMKLYPHQWSGGMLQRGALAAALLKNPELLLADEPTTALDVFSQKKILSLLKKCTKEYGLSVIFVTHDLLAAAKVADRIAVMYGGRIVEIGTTGEVLKDPRHPYTWGLMSSLPSLWKEGKPEGISGSPPDMRTLPAGDLFAPRNPYAMEIDWEREAPMFSVTDTHFAATWLLHPQAPNVSCPVRLHSEKNERGEENE
jgi:oligopeptide transport system ATP-binding protein